MARPSRSRFAILGTIALLHAGVGIAVYAAGVWEVGRLDGGFQPNRVVAAIMPEPEAAGGGAIKLPEQTVTQKEKPITKDLTQQKDKKPETPAKPTISTTPDIGEGSGSGAGSGSGSATSKGKCLVDCGEDKDPPKQDPPKKDDEVKNINPNELTLMRTGGSTQIHPSDVVKTAMLRDGRQRSTGVVKVCVAETGAISSVTLLSSTKYAAYDAALLEGVRSWTYRPYAAAGRTLKVCGTVTFVYSIK